MWNLIWEKNNVNTANKSEIGKRRLCACVHAQVCSTLRDPGDRGPPLDSPSLPTATDKATYLIFLRSLQLANSKLHPILSHNYHICWSIKRPYYIYRDEKAETNGIKPSLRINQPISGRTWRQKTSCFYHSMLPLQTLLWPELALLY